MIATSWAYILNSKLQGVHIHFYGHATELKLFLQTILFVFLLNWFWFLSQAEDERQRKEEQERREHEEYLLLKEQFTVEEEGVGETAEEVHLYQELF